MQLAALQLVPEHHTTLWQAMPKTKTCMNKLTASSVLALIGVL